MIRQDELSPILKSMLIEMSKPSGYTYIVSSKFHQTEKSITYPFYKPMSIIMKNECKKKDREQ